MEAGRKLVPHKAIADTDYDLDVANYKAAVANLEVGKATVEQAKAALAMAKPTSTTAPSGRRSRA